MTLAAASERFGLRVGDEVGSYRITDELGGGGMGRVYLAEHLLLGRPAAVKVLLPHLTHVPEIVQRFFNEARATTRIRHPGIVEIYDFGYTATGHAYIVMEYLDGVNLGDRLLQARRFTVPVALTLARRIASALAAAHDRGVIHRDLKPDNVFLVRDPEGGTIDHVKLLDFGIAKLAAEGVGPVTATTTGQVMGTPLYMSPEQCRGAGECDARSDLYSLGCVLFEMLVGRPPFISPGSGEVIAAHLHMAPPVPSSLVAAIPPEVDALVARFLAKEPAGRPMNAAAAIGELNAVVTPPSARTVLAPEPEAKPAPTPRRRGGILGVGLALLGVAAVSVGVALWQGQHGAAMEPELDPPRPPPPPVKRPPTAPPMASVAPIPVTMPVNVADAAPPPAPAPPPPPAPTRVHRAPKKPPEVIEATQAPSAYDVTTTVAP